MSWAAARLLSPARRRAHSLGRSPPREQYAEEVTNLLCALVRIQAIGIGEVVPGGVAYDTYAIR